MAAQFIVAYSKSIMGVGVFAGNPWNCAVTRSLSIDSSLHHRTHKDTQPTLTLVKAVHQT